MKRIVLSTVIALVIMLSASVVRSEDTIENKLTNLTWCFHRSQSAPMDVELSARCNDLFEQMKTHFGDNFDDAIVQHSRDMKELFDALPVDKLDRQTIIDIMYATRTEI